MHAIGPQPLLEAVSKPGNCHTVHRAELAEGGSPILLPVSKATCVVLSADITNRTGTSRYAEVTSGSATSTRAHEGVL